MYYQQNSQLLDIGKIVLNSEEIHNDSNYPAVVFIWEMELVTSYFELHSRVLYYTHHIPDMIQMDNTNHKNNTIPCCTLI